MSPQLSSPLYLRCAISLVLLSTLATACQTRPVIESPIVPPQDHSTTTAPTLSPLASSTQPPTAIPTLTPSPKLVLFIVPERWETAATLAISALDPHSTSWEWQLEVAEDPAERLSQGLAGIALVPGDEGAPAGMRPLALGVPFTAEWESVSLDQAQAYIDQGSPFVAVMDWAEMTPTLKTLLVDGKHPSDPTYPLMQPWSVISASGFEIAALEIGPLLADHLSQQPFTHLVAVGDIMLDRRLGETIASGNLAYPFELVQDLLSGADITLGNLESALGDQGTPENKGYTFRAPAEAAQSLAQAGFDLLSLANNHAMDFGPASLLDGIALLQAHGVRTVGAGENAETAHSPVILNINEFSIAFLAYVDVPVEVRGFDAKTWTASQTQAGVSWADPAQMAADVAAIRPLVESVVVLLHSGYEYVVQPSPQQVNAAHTAIDAGADLVLGHHTHVLQGIEFYNDAVIVYGLGNFTFDDGDVPQTALIDIWIGPDGIRELRLLPLMLTDDGRPRLPTELEANEILAAVYTETREVAGP